VDRYRLAPLREVRRLDERAKRNDLAAAVGEARATAADVAAAEQRVTAAREVLAAARTARDGLVASWLLALADRRISRCRAALDAAIGAHARAVATHAGRLDTVDAKRGTLTVARAEKELVERHFEKFRESQRKLAERREE